VRRRLGGKEGEGPRVAACLRPLRCMLVISWLPRPLHGPCFPSPAQRAFFLPDFPVGLPSLALATVQCLMIAYRPLRWPCFLFLPSFFALACPLLPWLSSPARWLPLAPCPCLVSPDLLGMLCLVWLTPFALACPILPWLSSPAWWLPYRPVAFSGPAPNIWRHWPPKPL
jgi:hypothetical protein